MIRNKLQNSILANIRESEMMANKWLYSKFIKNNFAQSTIIEYSVFVVCLILALISMQGYIKRGVQGHLRQASDQIGAQYDPTKTSVDFNTSSESDITTVTTVIDMGGYLNSTTIVTTNYDDQTRTGTETVGAF